MLVAYRLAPSSHGVDELVTPIALVETPGVEVMARGEQAPLDVLLGLRGAVPSRRRYFELLQRFLPAEKALALEAWERFGSLRFHDAKSTGDSWHFCLDDKPTAEQLRMLKAGSLDLTVVDAGEQPDPASSRNGADPDAERPWPQDGAFSGKALQLSERLLRDLDEHGELVVRTEDHGDPLRMGELRLATRGTQVAWRRRTWAFEQMLSGEGPPRLARLLGEMTGPPAHHTTPPALKERSIRTAFGARRPTPSQANAISVAVNSPDLAIIHGPPGTGKTRVIHAVSAHLADRAAPSAAGEPPTLLLTSHGQEAVRNVAEQTTIFDMPAETLGLREDRAQSIGAAREWADARLAAIARHAEHDAEIRALLGTDGAATSDARRVLYDMHREVATYELAPTLGAETAQLLRRIITEYGDHLDHKTILDLHAKSRELSAAASAPPTGDDQLLEAALRAARGIRSVATARDDDGPQRAEAAIAALQPLGLMSPAFEKALRAPAGAGLDEIRQRRGEVIDALVDRLEPRPRAGVDESVRGLLRRALDGARDAVLGRAEGIPVVLAEYRDALQHDLPQVQRLKREYASLVATTCQKAQDRRLLSRNGKRPRFETVIVDEAAQASPLDLLIPLCGATRRVILVGDHRQLPHFMERELEERLTAGGDEYSELVRRSLFEHVRHAAERQSELDHVPRVALLDEQFRMHPRLGTVMSRVFYEPHHEHVGNGEREPPQHGIATYAGCVAAWINVPFEPGGEAKRGTSWCREAEAACVADQVVRLRRDHPSLSVGVISFYRAQVDAILEQLAAPERGLAAQSEAGVELDGDGMLRVDTVDAFQGREFDVVLLSVTRSNDTTASADVDDSLWAKWGHLRLPNRMCVALSRQRALLLAVGDRAMATGAAAEVAVPGLWHLERLCCAEEVAAHV